MPLPLVPIVSGLSFAAWRGASMAIVAGVITGITYMFKTKLGLFVMGAMVWLGVNWGSYKLIIEPGIDLLLDYAQGGMGGGEYAATAIAWMGVLKFDVSITMVISAIVAKHAAMQGRLFLFKRGFGAPV